MRERGPIGPRGAIPSRLSAPALLLATVVAALLQVMLRAYVTDDTFIHCVFARQVATQGIFGFNSGQPVYGDTSPLWVLLLAAAHRFGLDPLVTAKVLSASAAIVLPVAVGAWCVRLGLPSAAAAVATLLAATEASIARWGASGMETLCGTLAIVSVCALLQGGRPRWARECLIGALLAAAALMRPEAGLLLALALCAAAWGALTGGMTAGAAAARVAAALAPMIAWWTYAWRTFGTLTPTTSAAKSSGLIGVPSQIFGDFIREGRVLGATEAVAVLACLVCALRPRSVRRWLDAHINSSLALALLWSGAVLLAYAVLGYEIVSRYLVPLLPVFIVAGVSAVCALWPRPAVLSRVLTVCALLSVAENAWVTVRVTAPQVASFTRGMETALIPAALWFRDHTPPGSVIALQDIGAVGYYGERPVLDLGGLVTPEITELRRRMDDDTVLRTGAFTAAGTPQYLFVRCASSDSLQGRVFAGSVAQRIFRVQMPNLGVTRPGPVTYTAYRLAPVRSTP